ncbi:MAG TPA: NAD(P)H-binding protein, partial [Ilumatobacteraceae bacterium]|nr:NAD(P)H-binding protein [Ilumatobacteraceae bacterium]
MAERFASPQVTVLTGASGWLGRALVHRLLADRSRHRLRLLAHTTAEGNELQALGNVEIIVGDIAKPDTAARLLYGAGTDADLIHTVGVIHPQNTRQFFDVNLTGTRNVADAALDHGVR